MADLTTPFATRLCLSGVESRRLLDTFRDFKIPHIQVSFYYLRRVFGDPLEFEEYAKHFKTVVIDSGTVYGNVQNDDQKQELLQDYKSYLSALNKKAYTAAVYEEGLELDKFIPDEALIYPIDDIREVFDNDLQSLMRNIKYVGVGQKECAAKGGENLIPLFAQANKTGTLLHAFGTGSRKILSKYPFYSANSSSWRSGSRYLNTYIYEGPSRGLRLYQPTDKSDPVKTERETKTIRRRQSNLTKVRTPDIYTQINWDDCFEGDSWEVDKGNLSQWYLFQQDLGLSGQNKYYLTDKERQDIVYRKRELTKNLNPLEDQEPRKEDDWSEYGVRTPDSDSSDDVDKTGDDTAQDQIVDAEVVDEPSTEVGPVIENPLDSLQKPKSERLTAVDDRMRHLRQCNFCILAERCPKYTADSYCAFGLPPENPTYDHNQLEQHIMEDSADLLAMQKDRILQGYLEEKMDASGLSKDLTTNIRMYMEMVQLLSEATDKRDEISVKAKGGTGFMDAIMNRKPR